MVIDANRLYSENHGKLVTTSFGKRVTKMSLVDEGQT